MCNSNIKYVVNNGGALISVANPKLNGTGTITDILTGASDGTIIRGITIKGVQSTTQGMIRFFIHNGISYFLFAEIMIPATSPTGVVQSYGISGPLEVCLPAGYKLAVSTENAESFAVTAAGVNWTNCNCS